MSDNIRPALYQAKYSCVIDGKKMKWQVNTTKLRVSVANLEM